MKLTNELLKIILKITSASIKAVHNFINTLASTQEHMDIYFYRYSTVPIPSAGFK